MKKSIYFLGGLAAVAGLSAAAGGILTKVDEEKVAVVATVEEEPLVILHYEIMPIATPVIRGKKVARYVQITARYELEGEETLIQAREILPMLRDDLVRSLHMDPIPLVGEDAELDMDALRERFMSAGKKFLGPDMVHNVTVDNAKRSGYIVRSSEPPPKKKKSSGGGH
ncbi:MAG: hypothetical protein IH905_15700 [Proteobacteria bacterium]|nr:hypothetical protein [Pseudomonadota bacterium]